MTRLLDPGSIPTSLWDANTQVLSIPGHLATAYIDTVDSRGIRHLLLNLEAKNDDGPIGGGSREETERHFVNRMDGSVARVLLALLDPRNELDASSDTLISPFSGGVPCVTDVPCGAGAGVLSILSSIAVLRESGVLPRIPLNVHLVAADISSHATDLANEMLDRIRQSLADQAIHVEVEWIVWDATDTASNTNLVRRAVIASSVSSKKLLLVANFSGFLSQPGKRRQVDPQLEELFRYLAGENSLALWLEPDSKAVSSGGALFSWLIREARSRWAWFAKISDLLSDEDSGFCSRARFNSILRGGLARVATRVVPVNLRVQE